MTFEEGACMRVSRYFYMYGVYVCMYFICMYVYVCTSYVCNACVVEGPVPFVRPWMLASFIRRVLWVDISELNLPCLARQPAGLRKHQTLTQAEDMVTMDNGCVCCTVRGDLVKALLNFLDRRHTFDCILLETTGIADPSPIVATFNQVRVWCAFSVLLRCVFFVFFVVFLFWFTHS